MFFLLESTDSKWLNFIESKPEANIFHHPAWINNLAECYDYKPFIAAVLDDQGEIRAGLPIMEVNSFVTGKRWVSLPFTDHCVPLYRDIEALNRLTDSLVLFANDPGFRRVDLRWEFLTNPDILSYSHHVLHLGQLNPDPQEVFKKVNKRIQRGIRATVNRGVFVVHGTSQEYLRIFYNHQLQTRRRFGIPAQPWRYFKLLGKNLLEKRLGYVWLVYMGDKCLAGLISLHWQQTITLKYAASSKEQIPGIYYNHLLYWDVTRWGCEQGYSSIDIGRSKNNDGGLRYFKDQLGYEEKPLVYSTINTNPPVYTGSKLLPAINIIIRNSPIWVNKLIGELLYKHAG